MFGRASACVGPDHLGRQLVLRVGAAGQSGKLLVDAAGWGKSGCEGGGQDGKAGELDCRGGDRRGRKSGGREGKTGAA